MVNLNHIMLFNNILLILYIYIWVVDKKKNWTVSYGDSKNVEK